MHWRLESAQAMLTLRTVYQSSYWGEFHQRRIDEEQPAIHPHKHLLQNYIPRPLAAKLRIAVTPGLHLSPNCLSICSSYVLEVLCVEKSYGT
jgi:hypothetical protein